MIVRLLSCLLLFPAVAAAAVAAPGAEAPGTETFAPGPEWKALQFQPVQIAPGSALDFSARVKALGPGARRNGVVISHGLPFLTPPESDRLTAFLAASGYGLVRLYLYTAAMPSVMDGPGSTRMTAEAQDRFDYFIAGLKRRGITYMLPLECWGMFDGNLIHDVPGYQPRTMRADINPYLPISADARRWLKEFSRNLLLHRNRYTGLALKDDPSLVGIELANEDSFFWELHRTPALIPLYQSLAGPKADLPKFVLGLQDRFYDEMKAFLRGLGVTTPLTDATDNDAEGHVLNRTHFDYVDLHGYWALYHAVPSTAPGDRPYDVSLANPNTVRWMPVVQATAPGRIFGLPFASGEYNSTYPSPYWAFTGPFEAALAATQGWSAIARCGLWPYGQGAFAVTPQLRIEAGHSPVLLMSERIGTLLLGPSGLPPLPAKVPIVLTPAYLKEHLSLRGGPAFPAEYTLAAYRCQIGSVLWTGHEDLKPYPVVVAPADEMLPSDFPAREVLRTGGRDFGADLDRRLTAAGFPLPRFGIRIDAQAGTARIVAPNAEVLLLPATVDHAAGEELEVAGNHSPAVSFVGSLDDRPLAASEHLLALYLTEVRNTGTVLEPRKPPVVVVRRYGTVPLLIQQGTATFHVRHRSRTLPEVWALRYDGTRASQLEVAQTPDGFAVSLPAQSAPDTFSAFELTWSHHQPNP